MAVAHFTPQVVLLLVMVVKWVKTEEEIFGEECTVLEPLKQVEVGLMKLILLKEEVVLVLGGNSHLGDLMIIMAVAEAGMAVALELENVEVEVEAVMLIQHWQLTLLSRQVPKLDQVN